MSGEDIPQSVRIRTGGDNEHRYRSIERARELYDCNRSDAVANAANDVPALIEAVQDVLSREDLTLKQRREIAERFNRGLRGMSIAVDESITLEK